MANTEQNDDREARTREVAYFLWLEEDRPEGQADRHWAAAAAVVAAQDASTAASIPPANHRPSPSE
jgi:hypothetical protein